MWGKKKYNILTCFKMYNYKIVIACTQIKPKKKLHRS